MSGEKNGETAYSSVPNGQSMNESFAKAMTIEQNKNFVQIRGEQFPRNYISSRSAAEPATEIINAFVKSYFGRFSYVLTTDLRF